GGRLVLVLLIPLSSAILVGRTQERTAGAPVLQRELHAETTLAVRISSDGKLALMLNEGNPTLWDVLSGRQLRELVPPGRPRSYDIETGWLSPSGRYVLAGLTANDDESTWVCVFESKDGRPVYMSAANDNHTTGKFAPDEKDLLLGRQDGKLVQVNLDN